ncbi:MAG TPA: IS21 family transposase [Acidiferrobacter sp.]|nr:IS21 family transposase [Acidiferrobacter sp.]
MPTVRLTMKQTREVVRLQALGLSQRAIARATGVSLGAVCQILKVCSRHGVSPDQVATLEDAALAQALTPPGAPAPPTYATPDCAAIHQEMKRKGATLQLLWQEYREAQGPKSYRYTQFCATYRRFKAGLKRSLRQTHVAGEKCFTDYAGPTAPVVNAHTGEIRHAQIFVAVLGCSNYTYVEATWTQTLPDWVASHVRAFEAFGGVTSVLVPDNLKAAVTTACRYEPTLNKTAEEFANHYGTVIIPARPRKPKDKSKVEGGVLIVERWILARLRHHTVFTLAELNQAIHRLVADMNTRPFQKLPGCRKEAFERLDKPALKPLPVAPYELATWKIARVAIDTHIEVEGHYYSVPHPLCRQQVEVRIAHHTIEVFFQHNRVASHARCAVRGGHTTVVDHLPKAHQKHLSWTPQRLLDWGASIGPATRAVVDWQLTHKPHPEQGYRACLGLLSLARHYTPERLEAACGRAVAIPSYTRQTVLSILKKGLDRAPLPPEESEKPDVLPIHENVRGPEYFH